ncbi:unnamed protein product, partial [Polarella glacialis]
VVNRLDSWASGPLCCARTYRGWAWLSLQFSALLVVKEYVCLCEGWLPSSAEGGKSTIELPLSLEPRLGGGKSVVDFSAGRRAATEIHRVAHLEDPSGQRFSLVEVPFCTGGLHQIRAHFSAKGHPIVLDGSYGAESVVPWCPRIFLHVHRLAFPPATTTRTTTTATLTTTTTATATTTTTTATAFPLAAAAATG